MNRTGLRLIAIIPLLLLSLFSGSRTLSAGQEVITDDGREVMLKQDGTWEFLSSDRFANTSDGRRVRLKQDGSWEYAGNTPIISPREVRTTDLKINIQKAVVETYEKKVQKNTRVNSQTVFHVNVAVSPDADETISIQQHDLSLIKVTDNKGRNYPVLSIQPVPVALEPGSSTTLVIRTDGSPQWWKDIKTVDIIFNPDLFAIEEPVTLIQNVDDMLDKKVDGFTENK